MRRCNLLIPGDGVAIIQYRCHLSGVPQNRPRPRTEFRSASDNQVKQIKLFRL